MVNKVLCYLKLVIWCSRKSRMRSLISRNLSHSSRSTVPIPSGLHDNITSTVCKYSNSAQCCTEQCRLNSPGARGPYPALRVKVFFYADSGSPHGHWSIPSRLPESAKKKTLTLSVGYGPKSGLGIRTITPFGDPGPAELTRPPLETSEGREMKRRPLPRCLRGLENVIVSSSGGVGAEPQPKTVLVHFQLERIHLMATLNQTLHQTTSIGKERKSTTWFPVLLATIGICSWFRGKNLHVSSSEAPWRSGALDPLDNRALPGTEISVSVCFD